MSNFRDPITLSSKFWKFLAAAILILGFNLLYFSTNNSADSTASMAWLPDQLPKIHAPHDMKIYKIITGANHRTAAFAYQGGSYSDKREFTMAAILVRHPKGDFLIDSGLGKHAREHFRMMPYVFQLTTDFDPGVPVVDQMAKVGYDYKSLKGILLTHAHWDHVGGIPDMSGIPVWLLTSELDFIRSGHWIMNVIQSFKHIEYHSYSFSPTPYMGFSESYDVYGDGSLVIVPAPGHTPGSVAIFANLPNGDHFAFIGDTVWQMEGVTEIKQRPYFIRIFGDHNSKELLGVIRLFHAINKKFPEIHIVPAHDLRAYKSIPALEEYAEKPNAVSFKYE